MSLFRPAFSDQKFCKDSPIGNRYSGFFPDTGDKSGESLRENGNAARTSNGGTGTPEFGAEPSRRSNTALIFRWARFG